MSNQITVRILILTTTSLLILAHTLSFLYYKNSFCFVRPFFVKVNLAKTRAHLLSARPDCVISPQHLAILQPPPSSLL